MNSPNFCFPQIKQTLKTTSFFLNQSLIPQSFIHPTVFLTILSTTSWLERLTITYLEVKGTTVSHSVPQRTIQWSVKHCSPIFNKQNPRSQKWEANFQALASVKWQSKKKAKRAFVFPRLFESMNIKNPENTLQFYPVLETLNRRNIPNLQCEVSRLFPDIPEICLEYKLSIFIKQTV